jgi:microcystin degradation protein MlrC
MNTLKLTIISSSIALLSACGGGGDVIVIDPSHSFLSVDNLNYGNGVVCVEDIFVDAYSAQGQQVARDLVNFYGTYNFSLSPMHQAYSAPTYCGGSTPNFVPAPGTIVDANYYYSVIVPRVR